MCARNFRETAGAKMNKKELLLSLDMEQQTGSK